jgi:hypothetical protein
MAKINDKQEEGEGGQLVYVPFWLICDIVQGGSCAK